MNSRQLRALTMRDTDVAGALNRVYGNEGLYLRCLADFLEDDTVNQINTSVGIRMWDEAFTAAHALKGVAGNMGFIPLMHAAGRLVVLIRGGRIREIEESLEQINSAYRDIVDGIEQCLEYAETEND